MLTFGCFLLTISEFDQDSFCHPLFDPRYLNLLALALVWSRGVPETLQFNYGLIGQEEGGLIPITFCHSTFFTAPLYGSSWGRLLKKLIKPFYVVEP